MSRRVLFKAVPRQPQYLILCAVLASVFVACEQQEGENMLDTGDARSIRSALSPTSSPYGKAFFSTAGVNCYQSGSHYMCAVDLRYAHVRTLHGTIYPRSESFYRKSVWSQWNSAPSPDPLGGGRKVVAVNTSFFNISTSPYAEISFPLKTDESGLPLTYGKDCDPMSSRTLYRKLLHVWNDRQYADVGDYLCTSSYDRDQLHTYGSASNIIGGLEETVPVGATYTNRTFIGVLDDDGDSAHYYETLLIFSTRAAITRDDAARELRSFGASKMVMFDGSGSSQMVVDGRLVVPSSDGRTVTNSLVVYAP